MDIYRSRATIRTPDAPDEELFYYSFQPIEFNRYVMRDTANTATVHGSDELQDGLHDRRHIEIITPYSVVVDGPDDSRPFGRSHVELHGNGGLENTGELSAEGLYSRGFDPDAQSR